MLGQAWRIFFLYKDIRDYYARLEGRARGTVPGTHPFNLSHDNLEYLYMKTVFSTPALSALLPLAGQTCLNNYVYRLLVWWSTSSTNLQLRQVPCSEGAFWAICDSGVPPYDF